MKSFPIAPHQQPQGPDFAFSPEQPDESAKTKRGRREGDGKKYVTTIFPTNVMTIYDILRQFATFYDNFRLFVPLT